MEKGKITKLAAWKSGKGFFVGIDGREYVILAATDAKVGDAVEYELANKFVYGKQVVSKLLLPLESYVQPARDEDRAKATPVAVVPFRAHDVPKLDAREEYWKLKEKRDAEREPVITRLSCISSACELLTNPTAKTTPDKPLEEVIITLAKRFEKYATEGE